MAQDIYTLYIVAGGEVLPAMIHSQNVEKFLGIGFSKSHEDVILLNSSSDKNNDQSKEEDTVSAVDESKENDKGILDEADIIDGMQDKDSIVKFVEENCGESVDKRGSLETVKEKAKAVINESKRVD